LTNWIFSCSRENWEILKERNFWAVRTEKIRDKIKAGDRIIFYITRSDPPSFLGLYKVVGNWRQAEEPVWHSEVKEGRILYPWQSDIELIQLGTANYKELSSRLNFVENKDKWNVYLVGTPSNLQRPISDEDYQLIYEEMKKPPTSVTFREAREPSRPKPLREEGGEPSPANQHKDAIEKLVELGEVCGWYSKDEFANESYRFDVVWKETEHLPPHKVFEVQHKGMLKDSLINLQHAQDKWRADLFLIVTDEKDRKKTEQYLNPYFTGSFHRIRHTKVLLYDELVNLYDTVIRYKDFVEKMLKWKTD